MRKEKEETIAIYELLEEQGDNLLAYTEEADAQETFSPTIFDDVFRTIVEDFPELLIALINEVFGTDYPEDTLIEQYRNEHMEPGGKIITDSILRIGNQFYHIECQSDDDANMVIRMVAYDISIALDHPIDIEADSDDTGKKRKACRIRFPQSCVMYIRDNGRMPDELEVEIEFADGFVYKYHTPTINVQHYTKKELFEKRLLAFLPYYVLRYEEQIKQMEGQSYDEQAAGSILDDLRDVCLRLRQETEERNRSVLYGGLIELIQKIARYAFRKTPKELKKGVSEAMGGQVIELKTMKIFHAGRAEGETRGRAEGVDWKGREVYMNCRGRGMSIEDAMAIAGISSALAEEAEQEWQRQESASV